MVFHLRPARGGDRTQKAAWFLLRFVATPDAVVERLRLSLPDPFRTRDGCAETVDVEATAEGGNESRTPRIRHDRNAMNLFEL